MGTFNNLTGQQFGQWKVIEYAGDKKWLCECQCEAKTRKIVSGYSLRSGKSTSCGCMRKLINSANKVDDLTDMMFGSWKVLEYQGNSMWLCECQCENKTRRLVKAQSLKEGKSKSCGHDTTAFKDLTGQTINGWYVDKYLGNQKYLCKGQLDEEKIVEAYYLSTEKVINYSGRKLSSKLINLKDKKFGYLKVIEYVGNNKWRCLCDCGNECIIYSHNLRRSPNTISCGCMGGKPLEKDFILAKIYEYIGKYGELPYRYNLQQLIDRGQTSVERYIKRYDLYELINTSFRSRQEREIYEMFSEGASTNRRDIIDGMELDIYYPDKKIAIEFNGSYWHSNQYKDKKYHQEKSIACARKGIQLIHIFEYEWSDEVKREKIIKILSNKLGYTTNNIVYARNTIIKEVNKDIAKDFINRNHLQNYVDSSINIACTLNDNIIGMMTFGKPRFNSLYQYELIRLCWDANVNVVGGAEKMLKYFINKYSPSSIISYSDLAKFSGNVYYKMGFKFKGLTEPNYVWWDASCNEILTRYQTMKHKLIEQGLGTEEQTEDEIMNSLGYYKIYDSGSLQFILEVKA